MANSLKLHQVHSQGLPCPVPGRHLRTPPPSTPTARCGEPAPQRRRDNGPNRCNGHCRTPAPRGDDQSGGARPDGHGRAGGAVRGRGLVASPRPPQVMAVAGAAAVGAGEAGDLSAINLSVQQVLSLWAHGTVLRSLTEMWYWVFLWALFSSLFVHGAVGVLMFVMLQRHRQGRLISVTVVSIGFLGSVTGAMITSAAVAGIYRVAGKNMAPLEALVFGVGQTVLTLIISFSRILATL
eukprot:XP_027305932.1 transmembrane protein 170B [Anas platyrhynchos]